MGDCRQMAVFFDYLGPFFGDFPQAFHISAKSLNKRRSPLSQLTLRGVIRVAHGFLIKGFVFTVRGPNLFFSGIAIPPFSI